MLNDLLGFLAGLGIFLFGTHLLSKGLQQLVATQLRSYLIKFTNTRLKGLLSGIVTTFFLQSSTVTSILVVGLVGSSVLTLTQALGVILGSAIGTTITVQILTFDVSRFSAIFILIGAILTLFGRNDKIKTIGQAATGFGFIFFGIGFITSSLEPLSHNASVVDFLSMLTGSPILFTLVCALMTTALHNSAAMIMIGISFVMSGVLTPTEVIPLVLGANVGGTIPILISSFSSSAEGKKVAFSYTFFKSVGVIVCLILLPLVQDVFVFLPGDTGREIANFHTLFNVIIAFSFLPFLAPFSKIVNRLFPEKTSDKVTIHLDESILEVPGEALLLTKSEIIRLAYLVREKMIQRLYFFLEESKNIDEIYAIEEVVDESYKTIQQYLLKLGQKDLSTSQSDQEVKLLYVLNDIENIGDTIVQCLNITQKSSFGHIEFSSQDRQFLQELVNHIDDSLLKSIQALENQDMNIARKNIHSEANVSVFEADIKFNHFNRLIEKNEYNPMISAIYLDIINQLLRVHQHSLNISRTVLGLI